VEATPRLFPAAAPSADDRRKIAALQAIHQDILANGTCFDLIGPAVVGSPVPSRIYLMGQAPGPHEARFGRPFAWTAGKTLFRWIEEATGAGEDEVRRKVYFAAVVRSFPGKSRSGGDRLPSPAETEACRGYIVRELEVLQPHLVIPVGRLAIREVLGHEEPIASVVGTKIRAQFHGVETDVICLPHPSGASTWFKMEPGKQLLAKALRLLSGHPEIERAFPRRRP
jgi:uracil-DNA glycosylase